MIIVNQNKSIEQLYLEAKAKAYDENRVFFSRSKTVKAVGMNEQETKSYIDNLTKLLSVKDGRMDNHTYLTRFKKTDIVNEIKRWTKAQNQFN